MQDWNATKVKQQARANAVAMAHDKIPVPLDGQDASDALGVLLGAVVTGISNGRTAGGLQSSLTDWDGTLDVKKVISSMGTSLIPFAPLEKSAERTAGVDLDPKRASTLELLAPVFATDARKHAQRTNFFGDPVTPQTLGRVVSQLTGSGVPWLIDAKDARADRAYRLALRSGWAPPSIEAKRLYKIGPVVGPLSADQLDAYTALRGPMLKAAIGSLPPSAEVLTREELLSELHTTFRKVDRTALQAVGAKAIGDDE